ncbi:hypothetical protein CDD83_881 [Cordyceps sp. RAO-2017]|nr:hypothetical protein CDD83_881 [Cordyceps sp. RAO-2017]
MRVGSRCIGGVSSLHPSWAMVVRLPGQMMRICSSRHLAAELAMPGSASRRRRARSRPSPRPFLLCRGERLCASSRAGSALLLLLLLLLLPLPLPVRMAMRLLPLRRDGVTGVVGVVVVVVQSLRLARPLAGFRGAVAVRSSRTATEPGT